MFRFSVVQTTGPGKWFQALQHTDKRYSVRVCMKEYLPYTFAIMVENGQWTFTCNVTKTMWSKWSRLRSRDFIELQLKHISIVKLLQIRHILLAAQQRGFAFERSVDCSAQQTSHEGDQNTEWHQKDLLDGRNELMPGNHFNQQTNKNIFA